MLSMMSRFWYTASAVPRYQESFTRCCAGSRSMNSPSSGRRKFQPFWIWVLSEWDLYWVRMLMRRIPELMQLDRGKSMLRYLPPKGTAGFECQRVSDCRREPLPPARIRARVFLRLEYPESA